MIDITTSLEHGLQPEWVSRFNSGNDVDFSE
jgi:hypothetical protein